MSRVNGGGQECPPHLEWGYNCGFLSEKTCMRVFQCLLRAVVVVSFFFSGCAFGQAGGSGSLNFLKKF